MILIPVFLITTILNVANLVGRTFIGRSILVPMAVLVAFGALGAVDDLTGLRKERKGNGLLARYKLLWQVLFALLTALALYLGLDLHSVAVPGITQKIDMGILYVPVAAFVIVAESNAVNLTDGLDGLAGSIASIAFAAYGVIAYLQGQIYLDAFCFTVVGAIMAFLWYNAYPADLFMGDCGALALGATLGVVALMTGQWLLLPSGGVRVRGGGRLRLAADRLLQADGRQALVQDEPIASPFRAHRLVRNARDATVLAHRDSLRLCWVLLWPYCNELR